MRAVTFEMTAANARIYADEVALVNVFRRIKRSLPTGYGEIHFTIEVTDHSGRSITTVVDERAIVDPNAPPIDAVISQPTTKAT